MPLEVRELIIRALVDPSKKENTTSSSSSGSPKGGKDGSWENQKLLLDQFNKMLKKRKER